ncbi:phage holin family protein [Globicatella sulfidifaciens]
MYMKDFQSVVMADIINNINKTLGSPLFVFFVSLLALDVFTGYSKGIITKQWDSKRGTDGLLRHLNVLISIVFVGVLSRMFNFQIFSYGWCTTFIINYIGSVIENLDAMGVPIPSWLEPITEHMKRLNDNKMKEILNIVEESNVKIMVEPKDNLKE